jgi:hypothetical protein
MHSYWYDTDMQSEHKANIRCSRIANGKAKGVQRLVRHSGLYTGREQTQKLNTVCLSITNGQRTQADGLLSIAPWCR